VPPVVALAKERITELSTRRKTIEDTIRTTEAQLAEAVQADEIEATLNAVPDLRDALKSPTADALTEILETFDATATYDKPDRALELAATLNAHRPPDGGRGNLQVAGAGFEPATFGL
jgi:autotransporter translocation and assembly factor TamB